MCVVPSWVQTVIHVCVIGAIVVLSVLVATLYSKHADTASKVAKVPPTQVLSMIGLKLPGAADGGVVQLTDAVCDMSDRVSVDKEKHNFCFHTQGVVTLRMVFQCGGACLDEMLFSPFCFLTLKNGERSADVGRSAYSQQAISFPTDAVHPEKQKVTDQETPRVAFHGVVREFVATVSEGTWIQCAVTKLNALVFLQRVDALCVPVWTTANLTPA